MVVYTSILMEKDSSLSNKELKSVPFVFKTEHLVSVRPALFTEEEEIPKEFKRYSVVSLMDGETYWLPNKFEEALKWLDPSSDGNVPNTIQPTTPPLNIEL